MSGQPAPEPAYRSIYWDSSKTRVAGFTTANRGKATTVRVELTVTDAFELGDIVSQLARLRDAASPGKSS